MSESVSPLVTAHGTSEKPHWRKTLFMYNVQKLSTGSQNSRDNREFILERSLANVVNVRKPSALDHHSLYTRECTQERNPMSVENVGKLWDLV